MSFKHHLTRKIQQAKSAPLWQWLIVIFLAIALPLLYTYVSNVQIEQTIQDENHATK